MEWFKCPTCIYGHPFVVNDDKPCPNLNLTKEQCQEAFNKPSVLYRPLGPFDPNLIYPGKDKDFVFPEES